MSTRANVILKDEQDKLIFYRHSDGYPEGTLPTLNEFLDLLKKGTIRNNVSQSAGWLIVIGANEYKTQYPPQDWKVGAYEPTTNIHGDIEYLYTIDLISKSIKVEKVHCDYSTDKQTFTEISAKNPQKIKL